MMINPQVEALTYLFPERRDRVQLLQEIATWKGLPLHVPEPASVSRQVDPVPELQAQVRLHEEALRTALAWLASANRVRSLDGRRWQQKRAFQRVNVIRASLVRAKKALARVEG